MDGCFIVCYTLFDTYIIFETVKGDFLTKDELPECPVATTV